jgi:type II secretory pathway pseudopilin PulG
MQKNKSIIAVLLALLVLGLLVATMAWAAGTIREDRTQWKIVSYQSIYLTAASGVTTLAYPSTKQFWAADIEIEGGPIRYYYDGRTPTSTDGRIMGSNNMLHLQSYDEVIKWKAILDSSGSGVTIVITFLGG